MIEKKADNKEILQDKVKQIDKSINNIENQKKQLNNIKDSFMEINQTSNKIIELLSLSIKGRKINARFNDMSLENSKRMKNMTAKFDDDLKILKKYINELESKKNKIQKEIYKIENDERKKRKNM